MSYSANREDVYLKRLFGSQDTGFYVDVGAAHPMFENDTKAMYDRGWSGINIEPSEEFFDTLATERPRDRNLRLAVSLNQEEVVFYQVAGTGLSTADPEEAARARQKGYDVAEQRVASDTLANILETEKVVVIDLLKVDVEGLELEVLQSNDWKRFRPKVIVVEATIPETPMRRPDSITPYLAPLGYSWVFFDGLNDYFVNKEFHVPPGAFDRPANIFDHFVTLSEIALKQERDFLNGKVAALQIEQDNASTHIKSLTDALQTQRNEAVNLRNKVAALRVEQGDANISLKAMAGTLEVQRAALVSADKSSRLLHDAADALAVDFSRATAELVGTHKRAAEFAAQLDSWTMRTFDLQAAFGRLTSQHDAMCVQLSRRNVENQTELQALRRYIHLLLHSTSWIITRPLRALRRPGRTIRILLKRGETG